MEHPKDLLNNALKEAMKNKDNARRDVIRLLASAIKQVEIDAQGEVSAEQAIDILQKEAKKRRESIAEWTKVEREDQVAAEQYELTVLEEFLPRQLSPEEIKAIVEAAIAETGATSGKDMGKVMGVVQPKTKGLADGKLVSQLVKELLGN